MRSLAYHNDTPTNLPSGAPADAIKAEFGRRLQAHIVRKGWNQSELARRAEKHCPDQRFGRDNVSVYIRGKTLPGPVHLNALCKALGVKPEELLPARAPSTTNSVTSPMDMKDMGDGRVWLRINQAISWEQALEIMRVLKDAKAEGVR